MIKGFANIKDILTKQQNEIFKIKPGETKLIRIITPLDQMISIYEHMEQFGGAWRVIPCLGKDECPLCQHGQRASLKIYFLVIDRSDNKIKLFKASKTVGLQLVGLVEEYGDITKFDLKIKRQGEKQNTTYQFFPQKESEVDLSEYGEIPEIESFIRMYTKEEILKLMEASSLEVEDNFNATSDDDFPF